MTATRTFVGRRVELKEFVRVLEDPRGQAVVVVGQIGIGKTWLLNKMAEVAKSHSGLRCGVVKYEVTPTDGVDSIMELMMDHAFEAGHVEERSLDGTHRRLEQWRSLLNVLNLGNLVMSLRRDPAKNARDQFLERLRLISSRMAENDRALFIIDPEKYMQVDSDQCWAVVVRDLPDRIKLIFAQRPDDALYSSEAFGNLKNVFHIPSRSLEPLDSEAVDDLLGNNILG